MRAPIAVTCLLLVLALASALGCGPADPREALVGVWQVIDLNRQGQNGDPGRTTLAFSGDGSFVTTKPGRLQKNYWEITTYGGMSFLILRQEGGQVFRAFFLQLDPQLGRLTLTQTEEKPPYRARKPETVIHLQKQ